MLHPARGVVLVGAVPWVTNYNIQLHTTDLKAGREIATAVSQRGGGLPDVEAMALPHSSTGNTFQLSACVIRSPW